MMSGTVAVDEAIMGEITDEVPEVAGPENRERMRKLGKIIEFAEKKATPELGRRAQVEKDGPGSKTWAQIAEETGCAISTIERSLEVAGLKAAPRSRNPSSERFDDHGTDPPSLPSPPVTNDDDLASEEEVEKAIEEYKKSNPVTEREATDEEKQAAISFWLMSVTRIFTELAEISASLGQSEEVREKLIRMVNEVI